MFLYIFAGFLTIASYSCEILLKAGINIQKLSESIPVRFTNCFYKMEIWTIKPYSVLWLVDKIQDMAPDFCKLHAGTVPWAVKINQFRRHARDAG